MSARDRPVSKPATDAFRDGHEMIWGKKKMNLPISKCLDLSTGHLTQETMNNPTRHLIAEYEYGAIFHVPEEVSEYCEPDLAVVLKFAQQHGCGLVRFDNIDAVIDELPYFEW